MKKKNALWRQMLKNLLNDVQSDSMHADRVLVFACMCLYHLFACLICCESMCIRSSLILVFSSSSFYSFRPHFTPRYSFSGGGYSELIQWFTAATTLFVFKKNDWITHKYKCVFIHLFVVTFQRFKISETSRMFEPSNSIFATGSLKSSLSTNPFSRYDLCWRKHA